MILEIRFPSSVKAASGESRVSAETSPKPSPDVLCVVEISFSSRKSVRLTGSTPSSAESRLYRPCGVHVQYDLPSINEISTAQFAHPRAWLPSPGILSVTFNMLPTAPQRKNFTASSIPRTVTMIRFHHGSKMSHWPSPTILSAKTCLCLGLVNLCHHCFCNPGTKHTNHSDGR